MEKYLKILGLKSGASEKEIKTAYRNLSKQFHPDLNPDNEEASRKMSEINEAYEILTGKSKPKQEEQSFRRSRSPFGFGFTQQKARHIQVVVDVTLEEVFRGVNKEVEFTKIVICGECNGEGGKNPVTCPDCGGRGMYRDPNNTMGPNTMIMCHRCGGEGGILSEVCGECHGGGGKHQHTKLNITIPRGATSGNLIIRGVGNEIVDGLTGDLVCSIFLIKHPIFKVEGLDLYRSVDIKFLDLLLGTEIELETLDGKVKITVPNNCNPTRSFRLKGKGLVDNRSGVGNLYVNLNVVMPKELTPGVIDKLKEVELDLIYL